MQTLKNRVYLLTGLLLLVVTALAWAVFGWNGHTAISNAQQQQPNAVFQNCTNQPEGSFYETWYATELTYTAPNAPTNAIAVTNRGGSGWGAGNFGIQGGESMSIAPTQWVVSGRMCR